MTGEEVVSVVVEVSIAVDVADSTVVADEATSGAVGISVDEGISGGEGTFAVGVAVISAAGEAISGAVEVISVAEEIFVVGAISSVRLTGAVTVLKTSELSLNDCGNKSLNGDVVINVVLACFQAFLRHFRKKKRINNNKRNRF